MTPAPPARLIWVLGNIHVGSETLMGHLTDWLNRVGHLLGLDAVILLAYIVAIPANEIIVAAIVMGYLAPSQMTELESLAELRALFDAHGWSLTTPACVMLFSLLHYLCATVTWTMYRETRRLKWTICSNLMALSIGVVVCTAGAQLRPLVAG